MSNMETLVGIYRNDKSPVKRAVALFFIGAASLLYLAMLGIAGFIVWLVWAGSTGNLPS